MDGTSGDGMRSYEPYAPRPGASHGVLRRAGHRLELYSIRRGEAPMDQSFCVWDLEIIARERDAYVNTILSGGAAGEDAYVHRRATG